MNDSSPLSSPSTGHSRSPWNKDKIIGPRPPLRPGHVWSIRAKLHLELRARDLALFNLAIDSKLRGCDLVGLVRIDEPHLTEFAGPLQLRGVAPPRRLGPLRGVERLPIGAERGLVGAARMSWTSR